MDLLVSGRFEDAVVLFENMADPEGPPNADVYRRHVLHPHVPLNAPSVLLLCDLNSDGLTDLVALHHAPSPSSSHSLVWFRRERGNAGDLSYAEPETLEGTGGDDVDGFD